MSRRYVLIDLVDDGQEIEHELPQNWVEPWVLGYLSRMANPIAAMIAGETLALAETRPMHRAVKILHICHEHGIIRYVGVRT